ncbi:MAG: sugar ABC transporter ATP-binding protein [Pseudobutyrivibrio sp.]|nr:sugar ABC transporter ATP-binding protein [Pseudobutyrivibrio sp.]
MELLSMKDIEKSFGPVSVLKKVSLSVEKGEVHALLGENGAGKSTLMNVLGGVYPKDGGCVVFDGNVVEDMTVKKAEEMGIAFVHQELNLFNDMTGYENVFLNKELTYRFGAVKKKEMVERCSRLFAELGVDIDPLETVANLKTSQKQLLEISKALFFDAKLLILDEPTTALNNSEVEHLFGIIRELKKKGTSFIFISHKMPEIFELCDSYTVFRNGEFVGTGKISETDPESVTMLMVGSGYKSESAYETREPGEEVLTLNEFSGEGFADISLTLHKGEILGFTGLAASGSSELMSAMFGLGKVDGGVMEVKGQKIKDFNPRNLMKHGVALLPSNRKENSVIKDMDLVENMYVAEQVLSAGKPHIDRAKEMAKFDSFKDMLNIKAQDGSELITALSGGNQQKVFIARWLNTEADILLFDNPTQGIDVGAKAEIYRLILELAKEGKSIIVNTLEIPELQKIADKCMIFYEGEIIKELSHDEITEETVMMYSVNAAK